MQAKLKPSHIGSARVIAMGWLVIGSLVFAFAASFGVAHYWFGVPVHEAHTNRNATPYEIATSLGALLAGVAFFGIAGFALLRWLPQS